MKYLKNLLLTENNFDCKNKTSGAWSREFMKVVICDIILMRQKDSFYSMLKC